MMKGRSMVIFCLKSSKSGDVRLFKRGFRNFKERSNWKGVKVLYSIL